MPHANLNGQQNYMEKKRNDYDLMRRALSGDKTAAKIYCGSYMLIRCTKTFQLYRFDGDSNQLPDGFNQVLWDGDEVYDQDGFLAERYWALPRIWTKN